MASPYSYSSVVFARTPDILSQLLFACKLMADVFLKLEANKAARNMFFSNKGLMSSVFHAGQ